jgi:DNA-nicking Smr family endonuclease
MSGPRRRRTLSPEERELWQRVADTAVPLDPVPVRAPAPAPAPAPEVARPRRPGLPRFRLGQNAPPRPPAHDLVPSLPERLAAAPVAMDRRAFTRMKRGKLAPEARIDLHGMTLAVAHPALIRFILDAAAADRRLVLVITGKGRRGEDEGPIPLRPGLLKHQVPVWLRSAPLGPVVLQVAEAHVSHGGAGAYYVYLRRRR